MSEISNMSASNGRKRKEDDTTVNTADKLEEMLGGKGTTYITGVVATTPPAGQVYIMIEAVGDTVIGALAGSNLTGTTMAGFALVDGRQLYGRFTSVTLTSGKLLAYKGV